MVATEIRDALKREPFHPFRVVMSSGESYAVRNPDLVVPMRNSVFIAMPDGERYTIVSYLNVTAVETHRNGNGKAGRKR